MPYARIIITLIHVTVAYTQDREAVRRGGEGYSPHHAERGLERGLHPLLSF